MREIALFLNQVPNSVLLFKQPLTGVYAHIKEVPKVYKVIVIVYYTTRP